MRDPEIEKEIRRLWPQRTRRAHKADFGRIFILAGSVGYTGAAALASFAALRAGAGLVTLGCPDKVYTVLAKRFPEVMVRPFPSTPGGSLSEKGSAKIFSFMESQDVVALGPGLGRHPSTQRLVRKILLRCKLPLVVDADAINALRGKPEILRHCHKTPILTPHSGEFVRVFGGRKPASDAERKKRASEIAEKFKVIMVLKGYRTVIAGPNEKKAVNPTGNPGMATGGTGDVLTGILAALMGQGLRPFDAARFGVYLHGLAGDLAARKVGEVPLVAGDLVEFFPQAVRLVGRG